MTMKEMHYTKERNVQILISLLKAHGIKACHRISRNYKYDVCR